MDEVDRLLALIRREDETFLEAARAATIDVVESNLNRKNTGSIPVDLRYYEALEECRMLVARMDSEELAEYLEECHRFGLKMANDRCSERIANRPIKAQWVHRQPNIS